MSSLNAWPQEALGRPDSALAFYKLADSLTHGLIRRNLLALSEYQQEVFKDKVKSVFETLPSFAERHSTAHPETGGILFDDALALKSPALLFPHAAYFREFF